MDSKKRLMNGGFTFNQADAILDVLAGALAQQRHMGGKAPAGGTNGDIANDVDSVVAACEEIRDKLTDERAMEFINSLEDSVKKYGKLTDKQMAALKKFHGNARRDE